MAAILAAQAMPGLAAQVQVESGFHFGSFAVGQLSGAVVLGVDGLRQAHGNLELLPLTPATPAMLTVRGQPYESCVFHVSRIIDLDPIHGRGRGLRVLKITGMPSGPLVLPASGRATFPLGGTLEVSSGESYLGEYSGTFEVTVDSE